MLGFGKWTKQKLEKKLRNHVCNVEFTKMDGTRRQMRATLRPDMVEEYSATSTRRERKVPSNQVPVYDLDKGEWRSFTVEQVNASDGSFEVERAD